jgi:predicted membrane channel-forming protein YqfA (hemolysin III family)
MKDDLHFQFFNTCQLLKQWINEYHAIGHIGILFLIVFILFLFIFSDESVRQLVSILYLLDYILIFFISAIYYIRARSLMRIFS